MRGAKNACQLPLDISFLSTYIPIKIKVVPKTYKITKGGDMAERKTSKKVSKKTVKKGDAYQCGVCGLAVTVDEECDCVDACDIICCGEEMKTKK
jgi:hypothetical protein